MRAVKKKRDTPSRTPAAPNSPVIVSKLLTGEPLTFPDFLRDEACIQYCRRIFGGRETAAGMMLHDYRKAKEYHYFGHRRAKPGSKSPRNPGKLDLSKSASRKLLKSFAGVAYRGDPDRRGKLFWQRVTGLVWDAYASLMTMRSLAEKIKRQEEERIARIPAKRARTAAKVREWRRRQRSMIT